MNGENLTAKTPPGDFQVTTLETPLLSNSLINRFQECFHPYFLIGIVVPIKMRWDHKRMTVFHDNRGQGSILRSKDLNTKANPL